MIACPSPFAILVEAAREVLAPERARVTSKDAKNIKKIIKAGRKYGVSKMRIKIGYERTIGIDNHRIKIGAHGSSKYELRVDYHDHELIFRKLDDLMEFLKELQTGKEEQHDLHNNIHITQGSNMDQSNDRSAESHH